MHCWFPGVYFACTAGFQVLYFACTAGFQVLYFACTAGFQVYTLHALLVSRCILCIHCWFPSVILCIHCWFPSVILCMHCWFPGVADELHISGRNLSVSVVCLYRPPPSRKNKLSNQLFLQEFPEFLTQFADSHSDLVLLGEFNFHYDDCADTQVNRLKTMLSAHGLTLLVDVPTHRCGHTLDWAVVRSDVSCLVLERVDDMPGLSDHRRPMSDDDHSTKQIEAFC